MTQNIGALIYPRSVERQSAYEAVDSERAYQNMRKSRDNGAPSHSVDEFILYMDVYLDEAKRIAATSWGPDAKNKVLDFIRKVTALGVACMEENGAPRREGF
jgi:hypothetical protein